MHWYSPANYLINTILKKFIALLWVCHPSFHIITPFNSCATAYSSPPSTKTQVLPATWLGEGLDQHSWGDGEGRVQEIWCIQRCAKCGAFTIDPSYQRTNHPIKATSTRDTDDIDLLDIPIDDLEEADELDDYLSKSLEKVCDPLEWWWDHRASYLKLSKMAFDFLSIPCELFDVYFP